MMSRWCMVRMQDAVCLACVDYADILYIAQGNAVLHACTHNLEHDVTMLHSLALQRCITCLSGCTSHHQQSPLLCLFSPLFSRKMREKLPSNGMATAIPIQQQYYCRCYATTLLPLLLLLSPLKRRLPSFLPSFLHVL